jgi:hypothetical protein
MFKRELLTTAACVLVLSVAPGLASAQTNGNGPNPDAKEMSKALFDYYKALEVVTKELQGSPSYATDPTGLVDIQTSIMLTNVMANMSAAPSGPRGNRPRWGFFDTPETRIGIDNPDTRYLSAIIVDSDDASVFRVSGNRSNSCDMITLINDGTNPAGGGDTIEDEDMFNTVGGALGPDEDFEIYISKDVVRDPSWLNWLEIPVGTVDINVSQRYTMCNYHTERPGDITIERVGTEGVAITADEFRDIDALTTGIKRATLTMEQQQPFWGTFSEVITGSGLPANVIAPWGLTGGLGITSQLSYTGWIDLEDDEALVIRVRADYPGAYGSVQLFNAWGSSLPWGHHMANGSFEISGSTGNAYFRPDLAPIPIPDNLCMFPGVDPAGCQGFAKYTTIIVSNGDATANNWIGTMGHRPVFMAGRLQSVLDIADVEEVSGLGPWMGFAQVVPLAVIQSQDPVQLQPYGLIPGFNITYASEAQRAAQIRERQLYQKAKYAPW